MTARRRPDPLLRLALAGAAALALIAGPGGGQTTAPDAPALLLPEEPATPAAADAADPAPPVPVGQALAPLAADLPPDPFDLPSATGRTVDVAGPLTPAIGGYGMGVFASSNARFVAGLMHRIEGPIAARWAHIVLRRALLSESAAPVGINPADWIATRAQLLMRLGEIDGAKALIDFVPVDRFTPQLYRVAGQVHFAAADPAGICPIAATGVSVSLDPLWAISAAMCAALEGDDITAARGFDALRDRARVDEFDVMLGERVATITGGNGRAANIAWEEVGQLTPFRFGITAAAGVAVPPALLAKFAAATRGASDGWVIRAGGISAELRGAALRPAAAMGVAGAAEMVALRSIEAARAGDQGGDASAAGQLRRAYVAAATADRLAALRGIWRSGKTESERYGAKVETALAAARLPVDAAFAADAPEIIAALLSAGLEAPAARWARVAEGGDAATKARSWALLAAGGAVEVTPQRFRDWLTAASAVDKPAARHRAALLLAALDGLGRTRGDSGWDSLRSEVELAPVANSWTQAIDAAAAARRTGEVAVLAGTGLQTQWRSVPPAHFAHIIAAYARVGREAEARLLAAEAVTRG